MDGLFFGIQYSGIQFDDATLEALRENFGKMLQSSDGSSVQRLEPKVLRESWKAQGIDKTMPSLYEMICWIYDANCKEGVESITFDEFLEQCIYYFSNRHSEEGLRRIFQLFDADNSDHLHYEEFKELLQNAGIKMSEEKMLLFFRSASGSSPDIDFEDFMQVMKKEYEF